MTLWKAVLVFLFLLAFSPGFAGETKNLITAGPSWEGFTNKDGTGLYHDIIRRLFPEYTVQHIYVATPQANAMVAIGRADIKMCETDDVPPLQMAKYPMYENMYYVVYLRDRVGVWQGEESLRNKRMAWRKGYYSQRDFTVPVEPVEVAKAESALQMVNHGRVDFYVDDMALIKAVFADLKLDLDEQRYGLQQVGARSYYPVFAATPRGNALRDQYDRGMEEMAASGVLQELYLQHGFPVPALYSLQKKGR